MSGSGRQFDQVDSSGAHVAQLRRLVWLLLAWTFFLTLGLAASISLHFIFPGPASSTMAISNQSKHPRLFTYDYEGPDQTGGFQLRWQNNTDGNVPLTVQEDGSYFIYLQVTLQHPNVSHEVMVKKKNGPKSKEENILAGHINATQLSTGFMGKGFLLQQGTILTVTCKPSAKVDNKNTYLGIIKLS